MKKMTEDDWKKFDSMTEKDIEAAIASDVGSEVPDSKEFFSGGRWVNANDIEG